MMSVLFQRSRQGYSCGLSFIKVEIVIEIEILSPGQVRILAQIQPIALDPAGNRMLQLLLIDTYPHYRSAATLLSLIVFAVFI